MIERVLVANRGEIARRIFATCRTLGISTVAVFSDADADAAFVTDADIAVALGGNTPAESYLRIEALVEAAIRTGADAIHPGYGFLAENADFARAVREAGLVFVGPGTEAIASMGSKLTAKEQMIAAGVPVLPSGELTGLDDEELAATGDRIGYPLLVKASAGGGGRGMRIVARADELAEAVTAARREAESAFGDGTLYAERYLSPSRHVEVQIFGDAHGSVVHFHERDCSIQRRHQKIIEEAPAPFLDDTVRTALHSAAVRAGEAIGYTNAGTVEFLVSGTDFYFLEVNTRLQVEHPVTEAVLGVDLVALQLSVAQGGEVPTQESIGSPAGHAVEARLYAEDPTEGWRPSTGTVHQLAIEGDVRVDSALEGVGEVSQFYDPMIAKVIAHAPTRAQTLRRLARSLATATIDGIATNRDLLVNSLRHPDLPDGRGDSSFLERHDPAVLGAPPAAAEVAGHAAAAALALQEVNRSTDRHTPTVSTGFRNTVTAPQRRVLALGGEPLAVDYLFVRGRLDQVAVDDTDLPAPVAHALSAESVDLEIGGIRRRYRVRIGEASVSVTDADRSVTFSLVPRFPEPMDAVEPGSAVATMPGTVVAVHVAEGDRVEAGDPLVVMEAMKMELTVTAATGGTVASVLVAEGQPVAAGTVLVIVDA